MSKETFVPGDVVLLKSGGPHMTVEDIGDYGPTGPEQGVACVWFEKNAQKRDVFDARTLTTPPTPQIFSI